MACIMWISAVLLFLLLFCVDFHSVAHAAHIQTVSDSDNCVLSFVVPREKMKSSCDFEEKFKRRMSATEMKVNVYKHQVNEMHTMLLKERELNAEKIADLEKRARENSERANSEVLLERRMSLLENEVGQLSNEVVRGRSRHAGNRNAIDDDPDYNFNALDQSPVMLPNLVKSMVQAELQNAMTDFTQKFENYVQEQIDSKVYAVMAESMGNSGLHGEGRLNSRPLAGRDKYTEMQKERASKSIMNKLNEFKDNMDQTGQEIAKNVNTYLQDSGSSSGARRRVRVEEKGEDEGDKYLTVSDKDRTNMITTSVTTKTTTTVTTGTDAGAGSGNEENVSRENSTAAMDYEEFHLTNTSELVITEDSSLELNDSFSGENPDSKESTSANTMVLTRKSEKHKEMVDSASSRTSSGSGGSHHARNKTTTMSKQKYEEDVTWKENMVMDQNYNKATEEKKLMEKVKMLLSRPMAEMMSLVEKQNAEVNDQIKNLQEEVTHKMAKDFTARLRVADQDIERNRLELESVSQAVQNLYGKTERLKSLETTVHELKENASNMQNDMPITVNEHGKRVKKLERLMDVYRQSIDHYKNETKQEYKEMRQTLGRETLNMKTISKSLQKNVTGVVEKLIESYNESQATQMEDIMSKMRIQEDRFVYYKLDVAHLKRKANGKNNRLEKELKELRENMEQYSSWDLKRKTDSMYRKFSSLEAKINSTSSIITDLKREVKLSTTDDWLELNFNYDGARSGCFGKQYVKKSRFKRARFVGVVLCSKKRYKILLGDDLEGRFRNIGDGDGIGQDHCEFVGGSKRNKITLSPFKAVFNSEKGYSRESWGQEPRISIINAMKPTPSWYECGVNIP